MGKITRYIKGLIEAPIIPRIFRESMSKLPGKLRETISGKPPQIDEEGAPGPINPETGMHEDYWILPAEERAKGYVRPYRDSYIHRGVYPSNVTRRLTDEELKNFDSFDYVVYEQYPVSKKTTAVGRYWTQKQLDSGCNVRTTMSRPLAETYARDPKYYGSTFCCGCGEHFPVCEFVWTDTDDIVGS